MYQLLPSLAGLIILLTCGWCFLFVWTSQVDALSTPSWVLWFLCSGIFELKCSLEAKEYSLPMAWTIGMFCMCVAHGIAGDRKKLRPSVKSTVTVVILMSLWVLTSGSWIGMLCVISAIIVASIPTFKEISSVDEISFASGFWMWTFVVLALACAAASLSVSPILQVKEQLLPIGGVVLALLYAASVYAFTTPVELGDHQ